MNEEAKKEIEAEVRAEFETVIKKESEGYITNRELRTEQFRRHLEPEILQKIQREIEDVEVDEKDMISEVKREII